MPCRILALHHCIGAAIGFGGTVAEAVYLVQNPGPIINRIAALAGFERLVKAIGFLTRTVHIAPKPTSNARGRSLSSSALWTSLEMVPGAGGAACVETATAKRVVSKTEGQETVHRRLYMRCPAEEPPIRLPPELRTQPKPTGASSPEGRVPSTPQKSPDRR
jgi:hypothetical protein